VLKNQQAITDGRVAENKALQKLASKKDLDEDTPLAKNFVSLCLSGRNKILLSCLPSNFVVGGLKKSV